LSTENTFVLKNAIYPLKLHLLNNMNVCN